MKNGMNSNQLKLIAIVAMTIDHLAWTFFPGYDTRWYVLMLHLIGRLTAPIMWFFVAEGYRHTRSVRNYAKRLFGLAILSHFAYNFCFGIPMLPLQTGFFNQTSVAWSLAWGLVLLWYLDQKKPSGIRQMIIIGGICILTFPSDWSCIAAMAIVFLGLNRGNFKTQMVWLMVWSCIYAAVYYFCIDKVYGLLQLGTCLSIPLLRLYNGQRGTWKPMGKVFYYYYPAHMVLCGLLRLALWQ